MDNYKVTDVFNPSIEDNAYTLMANPIGYWVAVKEL